MSDVKDVFRWYRDLPRLPDNFTSVQREEWLRSHLHLYNSSFAGEYLTSCHAQIVDVERDVIVAFADYHLDYLEARDGTHYHYEANTSRRRYAQLSYRIRYDEATFRTTLKSLRKLQMVLFDGVILNVRQQVANPAAERRPGDPAGGLLIELSLRSLKPVEVTFLHAALLDETLQYRPKSACFIATAAFSSPDAPEVIMLRRFRDRVLLHTAWGTRFVKIYSRVSPPIARAIRLNGILRAFIRLLVRYVAIPGSRLYRKVAVSRGGLTSR